MEKVFELKEFGTKVVLNKFAKQADGAVWLEQGGTVILATATSAKLDNFPGFLPLSVEFREQFAAAGKIPGGYHKREGKSSEKEVLASRLIDRALRPLFPATFFDEVQIITTVYSADKDNLPEAISLLAASLSLSISKIPFMGPIGAVEIARVDGEWIFSPTFDLSQKSSARIVVAGTSDGVCMLEGAMESVSEKDLVDIIFRAHEQIKKQVAWQEDIVRSLNIQKEEIKDTFDWSGWESKSSEFFDQSRLNTVCKADKFERSEAVKALKDEFLSKYKDLIEEQAANVTQVEYVFDNAFRNKVTDWVFENGKRVDGRSFDQIRPISTEVGILPRTHGSAFFQRGPTQALVTATLGSAQDEQRVDALFGDVGDQKFMVHYNFPPFSVGEVRPLRGPGRREVGHGNLAYSALKFQIPFGQGFDYTVRVVSDILECDGSSSMATVCGTTMAMLNAGVPLRNMVAGVAMGLLKSSHGKFQTITDLTGFEDAFGFMDFKVAGTENGVTAIQMDIKNKAGLPREVFENALSQAKDGRLFILGKMKETISNPSPMSDLVPKMISVKIDPKKIGAVIGTGGKVIKDIIEKTGTKIDTEDDGTVKIFGGPDSNIDLAINWIKTLAGQIETGTVYHGRIKRLADFGIFVEIVPGLDGLLHISQIPKAIQKNLSSKFNIGDPILVEVRDYDAENNKISLKPVEEIQ
jgi:polyribonucleotide nucleotidyltransferase